MLLTEYNEKKYMKLFRKEAREEGRKEGQNHLIITMLQNGASPEYLSKITGLSLSEISEISQNKKSFPDLRQTEKDKKKRRS